MELSKRLHAVAGLVTEGASVADIGTDHGYIPIYRNDRGRWLQMTLTTAGIRHTIALIVRVKNVSLLRYVSTAKITIC